MISERLKSATQNLWMVVPVVPIRDGRGGIQGLTRSAEASQGYPAKKTAANPRHTAIEPDSFRLPTLSCWAVPKSRHHRGPASTSENPYRLTPWRFRNRLLNE